jgi:hypothetical protein
MAYPSSAIEFPPLADLSLNDCHPASHGLPSHVPSRSTFTFPSYQLHDPHQQPHLSPSGHYRSRWSVPEWQAGLEQGSNSVPSLYTNAQFESPSWGTMIPPYPKSNTGSLFLPRLPLLDLELPSSPSDTCSSAYSDLSPSPSPSIHVVCDIPVVAPRPLPYHSPTFLQFDLPDIDEDLSRPPYTRGPAKRKRESEEEDLDEHSRAKRHAVSPARKPLRSRSAMQGIATRAIRRQTKR